MMGTDVFTERVLEGLTASQREAVTTTEGPLLVLAGPGSGKTRVITRRIAYLIACGVPRWQILALTFTNKAAAEMRERIVHLLGDDSAARGLTVATFHSLCARLLRRYSEIGGEVAQLGIKPDYAIYPTADQLTLVKRVLKDLDLSTTNFPPRSVLGAISNLKNELKTPEQFKGEATDFYSKHLARVYEGYQAALRKANAVDFDDLLLLTARMLRHSEEVRRSCQQRWQYTLIDEYQDTNHAQFVLASLLAGEGRAPRRAPVDAMDALEMADAPAVPEVARGPNICVVGDPDQSIYGWRGADIANILEFETNYPSARTIALGENFRSTKNIIRVADTLIRNNTRRKHKDLTAAREAGQAPEVTLCRDEHHEAKLVVDWLRERHEGRGEGGIETGGRGAGVSWKDMAVFYRTNALSRVMEEELRNEGVPYVIARGTAFYEREEVKNAIAYLKVVANPADDVSLGRIVNVPSRGIGKTSLARVETAAAQRNLPLIEAMRLAAKGLVPEVSARASNAMGEFLRTLDEWTGAGSFMGASVSSSLHDLVDRVVSESGLEKLYRTRESGEPDEDRLANLAELISSAAEFEEAYDPTNDPANELDVGPFVDELGAELTEAPGDRGEGTGGAGGGEGGEAWAGERISAETPPLLAMLRGYLERVALVADADQVDPSQGAVTLMTLHAAKGLEFPAVAMIGMEEGTLPHSRAFESEAALEEERRLCFVGITRAMDRLLMTCARYRATRGVSDRTIPSRFLGELPEDELTIRDESDQFAFDPDPSSGPSSGSGRPSRGSSHDPYAAYEAARLGGSDRSALSGAGAPGGLREGMRVRHPQFGLGTLVKLTAGRDARATVEFQQVGVKTLVLEYARLTPVG